MSDYINQGEGRYPPSTLSFLQCHLLQKTKAFTKLTTTIINNLICIKTMHFLMLLQNTIQRFCIFWIHLFSSHLICIWIQIQKTDEMIHGLMKSWYWKKIIYLKTYKHSQWNGFFSALMDIIEINLRLKSMELVYFWSLLLETVVQKIDRCTKKVGQMEKYF